MRQKLFLSIVIISLYSIAVQAQEETIPKFEAGVTYSYLREGSTPGYTGTDLTKGFGANGILNINRWLGLELDMSHHWGNQPLIRPLPSGRTEGDSTVHTLMGGPRFTYLRTGRVTPFAHILVGGAGIYSGYTVPAPTAPAPAPTAPAAAPTAPAPTSTTPAPTTPATTSGNSVTSPATTTASPSTPGTVAFEPANNQVFAWGVGGGFDVRVNDHFSLRPLQADYLNFRTDGFSGKPVNNLRLSGGVVFRFGSK